MKLRPLIFLILIPVLIGCQREIVIEHTIEPAAIKPPGTGGVGTVTGGGGSGSGGLIFEAWAVDIAKTEEYKTVVLPIIEKLRTLSPRLAADLTHITNERTWMILPIDLPDIQAARPFVDFEKDDQLAWQSLMEVFIDKRAYDKMPIRAKGALLVHESVMGARLMEFKKPWDQCKVKALRRFFVDQDFRRYGEARKKCADAGNGGPGQIIGGIEGRDDLTHFELVANDYWYIRNLVSSLLTKIDQLDSYELNKFLNVSKIGLPD